jgi:hypothetical protein
MGIYNSVAFSARVTGAMANKMIKIAVTVKYLYMVLSSI